MGEGSGVEVSETCMNLDDMPSFLSIFFIVLFHLRCDRVKEVKGIQ